MTREGARGQGAARDMARGARREAGLVSHRESREVWGRGHISSCVSQALGCWERRREQGRVRSGELCPG